MKYKVGDTFIFDYDKYKLQNRGWTNTCVKELRENKLTIIKIINIEGYSYGSTLDYSFNNSELSECFTQVNKINKLKKLLKEN